MNNEKFKIGDLVQPDPWPGIQLLGIIIEGPHPTQVGIRFTVHWADHGPGRVHESNIRLVARAE